MNFYKRHLGDYAKDTRALSVFEHGVYTLLLDFYYSEEKPVTDEDAHAICRTANAKERASVDKVLARYFKRTDEGWRHSYADRVIQEACEKSAKASGSASKRWDKSMRTHSERIENASPIADADAMRTHSDGNATCARVPLATSHEEETSKALVPDVPSATTAAALPDDCPHTEIIAAYHRELPMLRQVAVWSELRRSLLRSRWREAAERRTVAWWEGFFRYVATCPLLVGQHDSRSNPGWQADLEWLVRPANFVKVIEGKYEAQIAQKAVANG